MLDAAVRATIATAIATLAPAYGLDPLLVQALSNRELADGRLVSAPNANGSRDYGPLQVNDAVLPLLGGKWATLDPRELVDDPFQGVEAGLIILRWRVYESLGAHNIAVPLRPGGGPDYVAQAAVLKRLPAPVFRSVMYQALAGYNAGDAGMADWPNVEPVVLHYVAGAWREYERLQKVDNSSQ